MSIGYLFALAIGITLGLLGSGGSILAVPVLVYAMGIDVLTATSYSLGIVGITALLGAIQYIRHGNIDIRTALWFGVPDSITLYLTRRIIVPVLPDTLLQIGTFSIDKDDSVLLVLAMVMIAAAYKIIRHTPQPIDNADTTPHHTQLIIYGALVGILTGFVGAGGGFIIIPTLVLLAHLPMKQAVGTSLLIIAWKSLVGFTGDVVSGIELNWLLLTTFTTLSLIGSLIGVRLSHTISAKQLKPAFGWFIILVAVYIIVQQFALNA